MKNNSDYFEIGPSEKQINEFIQTLKFSVEFERIEVKEHDDKKVVINRHWLGSKILTNRDMKIMCSTFFGKF